MIVKDKEVAAAGVKEAEEQIKLEEINEKMGVKQSAESVQVKVEPTSNIKLPLTPDEIKSNTRKGQGIFNSINSLYTGINFSESIKFLAALLRKHLKRIAGQPA